MSRYGGSMAVYACVYMILARPDSGIAYTRLIFLISKII